MGVVRTCRSIFLAVLVCLVGAGAVGAIDVATLFREFEQAETEAERSRLEEKLWEIVPNLGSGDFKPLLPGLLGGLESKDAEVRTMASGFLATGSMSSVTGGAVVASVVGELVEKLGDPNPQVRANLTLAITWTQPAPPDFAESAMRELLGDQNIEVRRHAVSALSRLTSPDQETIEAVRRLAESSKAGNDTALRALGAFGRTTPEVLQVFVEALKESDMARKMAALNGLRQLGAEAEAALPEIERLAASASESDVVRRNAEATLNAIRKD